MKVGDLVEYSYTFDSESIDHWTRDNSICFLILEQHEDGWFWAKPQFALNEGGNSVLAIARDSEYPGTRDGYWLVNEERCRVIKTLSVEA